MRRREDERVRAANSADVVEEASGDGERGDQHLKRTNSQSQKLEGEIKI